MNPLNCNANIWVNANAGSGKTTILIKRMLALILNGAKPQNIVAITYTNVGTEEIKKRFFNTIEQWKYMEYESLAENLSSILEKVENHHLEIAKNLFDNIILSGIALSVDTIHAFCYKILENIANDSDSHFNVMLIDNNIAENEITTKLTQKTVIFLNELASFGNDIEKESAEMFLLSLTEDNIKKFIKALLQEDFRSFKNQDIKDLLQIKQQELAFDLNKKTYFCIAQFDLERMAISLKNCGANSAKRGTKLEKWLNLEVNDRIKYLDFLFEVFLVMPNKNIGVNHVKSSDNSEDKKDFSDIAQILYNFNIQKNNLIMYNFSVILPIISDFINQTYNDLKNEYKIWDYNDVLNKTLDIVKKHENLWVLYKLSYKIEHFLLDEAQDTNEKSWQIIEKITEDFFDGQNIKTIFIVGDEKQSIFSFQGAKFELFNHQKHIFETRSKNIKMPFFDIDLNISYRSCPIIVDFINKLCQNSTIKNLISSSSINHITCDANKNIFGEIKTIEVELKPAQPIKTENLSNFIDTNEYLEATYQEIISLKNKGLKDSDIIILSRKKGGDKDIIFNLFNYLTNKNIEVENLGKINITNHIIFYDFLSLLNFWNNPRDELNLACLLNSCFGNLGIENIDILCKERIKKNRNLWEYFSSLPQGKFLNDIYDFYLKNGVQDSIWHILYDLDYINIIKKTFGNIGEKISFIILNTIMDNNYSILSLPQIIDKLNQLSELVETNTVNSNAVRLSTIHNAKGLESKAVIIIDIVDNISQNIKFNQGSLLKLTKNNVCILFGEYENSAVAEYINNQKNIIKAEEMRLLYVAITRSKQYISIITKKKNTIKINENDYNNWGNIIKNII